MFINGLKAYLLICLIEHKRYCTSTTLLHENIYTVIFLCVWKYLFQDPLSSVVLETVVSKLSVGMSEARETEK